MGHMQVLKRKLIHTSVTFRKNITGGSVSLTFYPCYDITFDCNCQSCGYSVP